MALMREIHGLTDWDVYHVHFLGVMDIGFCEYIHECEAAA